MLKACPTWMCLNRVYRLQQNIFPGSQLFNLSIYLLCWEAAKVKNYMIFSRNLDLRGLKLYQFQEKPSEQPNI